MIKLNCDIGESFGIWKMGNDEVIFPLIDMANLACGFHASDALTMQKSVQLAKSNNVIVGAHIAYQDLVGFGRRSMKCSDEEIEAISLYQISALNGFCKANDLVVSYVKPHGALYNDMMSNKNILISILKAIASYDVNIKLMILSTANNDKYKLMASRFNIELIYEVFADRNYTDEGLLVSRNDKNGVIDNIKEVIKRINTLKNDGYLESINNKKLYIQADTICVHGDNEKALEFVKQLKKYL
jgi:UPF0271 protein